MTEFTFVRDDSSQLLRVMFAGRLSVADWAAAVARQIESDLWHWPILFDVTLTDDASSADVLSGIRARVPELERRYGARGPVAAVVPSAVFADRHADFIEHSETVRYLFEVFADTPTADDWLRGVSTAGVLQSRQPDGKHVERVSVNGRTFHVTLRERALSAEQSSWFGWVALADRPPTRLNSATFAGISEQEVKGKVMQWILKWQGPAV